METQIAKRCPKFRFPLGYQLTASENSALPVFDSWVWQRWHSSRGRPTGLSLFICHENLECSFWPEFVVAYSFYSFFRHVLYGKFILFFSHFLYKIYCKSNHILSLTVYSFTSQSSLLSSTFSTFGNKNTVFFFWRGLYVHFLTLSV